MLEISFRPTDIWNYTGGAEVALGKSMTLMKISRKYSNMVLIPPPPTIPIRLAGSTHC